MSQINLYVYRSNGVTEHADQKEFLQDPTLLRE